MQLVSNISNLCDLIHQHHRQTDGRHAISIPCDALPLYALMRRTVKTIQYNCEMCNFTSKCTRNCLAVGVYPDLLTELTALP